VFEGGIVYNREVGRRVPGFMTGRKETAVQNAIEGLRSWQELR